MEPACRVRPRLQEGVIVHSICVIAVYFGRLPSFFDLWKVSAARNGSIDFLLVTDQNVTSRDSNIHIHNTSFEDVRHQFQNIFPFDISMVSPRKLCDFKPAYGEVFAGLLDGYDFWAHADLDVIWGELRTFLTPEILVRSDRIFGGGHLSLYRNTHEINRMYQRTTSLNPLSYREVFSSPEDFAFDEWGPRGNGMNAVWQEHKPARFYLDRMPYADIKVHTRGLRSVREGFGDDLDRRIERSKRNVAFSYRNGVLAQHWVGPNGEAGSQQEAYLHLQKRPLKRSDSVPHGCNEFAILPPNRLEPLPAEVTAEFLRKHAREVGVYPHSIRVRYQNIRSKVARLRN